MVKRKQKGGGNLNIYNRDAVFNYVRTHNAAENKLLKFKILANYYWLQSYLGEELLQFQQTRDNPDFLDNPDFKKYVFLDDNYITDIDSREVELGEDYKPPLNQERDDPIRLGINGYIMHLYFDEKHGTFNEAPEGFDLSHLDKSELKYELQSLKTASVYKNIYIEDGEEDYDTDLDDIIIPKGPLSCYDIITNDHVDYRKYLSKNPKNFIIFNTQNGDKMCDSVNYRIRLANTNDDNIADVFYECSDTLMDKVKRTHTTPLAFGKNDYHNKTEYIKIGSYGTFIVKPDWLFYGIPPEPKIFKLVSTGTKKYLLSRYIAEGFGPEGRGVNVVSGTHCDLNDYFEIFNLVPVTKEEIDKVYTSEGGKKKRRNTKKNIRKTKNKKGGKKQKKKTLKKRNIYIRKNRK